MNEDYIIFDGNCGFCNKAIMFIAKNDKKNNFKFVSNISVFGINLLSKYKIRGLKNSTIILIDKNENAYLKSVAIRKILLKIPFYKLFGYLMFLFPKQLSDYAL